MTLSDQVDKQLAELNQALDALEASVRRVRRFLNARPSPVQPPVNPRRWGEVYDGGQ